MGSISSVLAQASPAATTNTDIYTVPNGYSSVIETMTFTRTSGGAAVVRVAIRPGGATLASKHYILYGYQVTGAYSINSVSLPLASGDVVTVYSDVADTVFNLFGTEESA